MLGLRCNRHGCLKAARFTVRLNIPAKGYSGVFAPSYKVLTKVVSCTEHLQSLHPKDFMTGAVRAALEGVAKGQRIAPPDFSRALLEGVPITYETNREKNDAEKENQPTQSDCPKTDDP